VSNTHGIVCGGCGKLLPTQAQLEEHTRVEHYSNESESIEIPITCKTCGREVVPDWDGKGNCISCARDEVLGSESIEEILVQLWNDAVKAELESDWSTTKIKKALQAIEALYNQRMEYVIGEDGENRVRNQLRAEQRTRAGINKKG
jgi:hypothetical protein